MPSANLRPSRSHWSSPDEETRFPWRWILDRTGTHGLPDPRSPVTSRFRPIFEDEQDAADDAAKASRISERASWATTKARRSKRTAIGQRLFIPAIPLRQIANPASTNRRSRRSRFDAMEDGGAGEFSGVVRSRCRRWWGWSGQFSPFRIHHH